MNLTVIEYQPQKVLAAFRRGEFDNLEVIGQADERDFFQRCFQERILVGLADSMPTARKKEEVPRWFILAANLSLKLHGENSYLGFERVVRCGGLLQALDPAIASKHLDAQTQRWLGLTNYFYLPLGRPYDNRSAVNVSTARQFTDVPQIGYTEGLGKFSPALKGVFFDLIANASFHTNGNNPVSVVNPATSPFPGVLNYGTLTQAISYDVKAFLRYEPKTSLWFAVGIEKSWGGEQIARNGTFTVTGLPIVIPQADLSLGKDDFLRGHFQFHVPVAQDFVVAADIFHDFDRVGGFRQDIGAEIRLTKFFFPQPPSK